MQGKRGRGLDCSERRQHGRRAWGCCWRAAGDFSSRRVAAMLSQPQSKPAGATEQLLGEQRRNEEVGEGMISFWHVSLLGAGSGRSLPWGSFTAQGTASSPRSPVSHEDWSLQDPRTWHCPVWSSLAPWGRLESQGAGSAQAAGPGRAPGFSS